MSDHPPPRPDDRLLQRYQEANALDTARPDPALRDRVLAQARAQAAMNAPPRTNPHAASPAANDRAWTLRALGSLAVLGLVGLLALQFDRGTSEEQDLAFGSRPKLPAPSAQPASAAAIPTAPTTTAPAADAPVAARPPQPATGTPAPQPAPRDTADAVVDRPHAAAPTVAVMADTPLPEPPRRTDTAAESMAPHAEAAAPALPAAPAQHSAPAAAMAPPPTALARRPARATQDLPPLVAAAAAGQWDAVQLLLAQGADVNQADARGRTALMRAAARGDDTLVQRLLAAGADASATDQQGWNAATHARKAGHNALADRLDGPPTVPELR